MRAPCVYVGNSLPSCSSSSNSFCVVWTLVFDCDALKKDYRPPPFQCQLFLSEIFFLRFSLPHIVHTPLTRAHVKMHLPVSFKIFRFAYCYCAHGATISFVVGRTNRLTGCGRQPIDFVRVFFHTCTLNAQFRLASVGGEFIFLLQLNVFHFVHLAVVPYATVQRMHSAVSGIQLVGKWTWI